MRFGPTAGSLAAVSGPNNPVNNFFCSQVNGDAGTLDTSGTFGTRNHTPGSNGSGCRQGWDITNVDVSARLVNGQTSAVARGTTSNDRYTIACLGLQIDVGSPVFPTPVLSVDKSQTCIGDILTYTARLDNTAGSADAVNVVYTDSLPSGTVFVPGSFTLDDVAQPAANPVTGVSVGVVPAGVVRRVSYKAQVVALPAPPAPAEFRTVASWTYQYESCGGFPLNNGTVVTEAVVTGAARLEAAKSADPPGQALPGETVTYTITVANSGTANSAGTTLADPIPTGMIYVPSSTTLNGAAVPDVGGEMPFAAPRPINSPGEPAGQINIGESAVVRFRVQVAPDPPLIITNTATIDPDGSGPAPPLTVSITNPPVRADLGITLTDGRDTVVAGTANAYTVTVTNHGPDGVIGFVVSTTVPPALQQPVFTPQTGTYDANTGLWTLPGKLFAGESVVLTIAGTVSTTATGTLTVSATVSPTPGIEDSNPANNTSSDTDAILCEADLAVTKTDGRTAITPGMQLTYTITVANAGPSRVQSVLIEETLPELLRNPVFTPAQGVYNEETGLWSGLNLMPGQQVALTLTGTVDVSVSGAFTNTVTVSPPGDVTDPVPANNTATDTDTTNPQILLHKTVDPTVAPPGAELVYAVAYRLFSCRGTGEVLSGGAAEVGYRVWKDLWASLGYCFDDLDSDLTGGHQGHGLYFRLRVKFDENTLRGMTGGRSAREE